MSSRQHNTVGNRSSFLYEKLKGFHLPMRRHRTEPRHAAVLHWRGGVEALRHGVADDGAALLLERGDQRLLLRHQRVDPRRLGVEEGGDGALFGDGREGNLNSQDFRGVNCRIAYPYRVSNNVSVQAPPEGSSLGAG